jgi:hypothetical protein
MSPSATLEQVGLDGALLEAAARAMAVALQRDWNVWRAT